MNKAKCPSCGRQGYERKDKTIGCQACGHGIKEREWHTRCLRCPECARIIAYVRADNTAKCAKCGEIKSEEIKRQKLLWEKVLDK